MEFTDDGLRKCCDEWQRILRLQDWEVDLSFSHTRNMLHEGKLTWGSNDINPEHRFCTISILHADDCESDEERAELEATLVHELLHLYFLPVRGINADLVAEEQAINAIATALVNLREENK